MQTPILDTASLSQQPLESSTQCDSDGRPTGYLDVPFISVQSQSSASSCQGGVVQVYTFRNSLS